MADDLMTPLQEEPSPPYEGKMEPGQFEVLCHGGTHGNPVVLEFVDVHPDLQDFLEEEVSNISPFLEDLGWSGELDGLAVILMRYTVNRTYSLDGPDDESEWQEVSRTHAEWSA